MKHYPFGKIEVEALITTPDMQEYVKPADKVLGTRSWEIIGEHAGRAASAIGGIITGQCLKEFGILGQPFKVFKLRTDRDIPIEHIRALHTMAYLQPSDDERKMPAAQRSKIAHSTADIDKLLPEIVERVNRVMRNDRWTIQLPRG